MSNGVNVEEAFTSQFPLAVAASEDLAAWIAKVVYTEEYGLGGARQKRAIKRVYGSIYYHSRMRTITKLSGNRYNVAEFFEWACEMKKWSEALSRVPYVAKSATVNLDVLEIAHMTFSYAQIIAWKCQSYGGKSKRSHLAVLERGSTLYSHLTLCLWVITGKERK